MNGWTISVVAFYGAMAGFALMFLGQVLMWFAPVQSHAFRNRFKLSLIGAAVLLVSALAMAAGAVLAFQQARLS